MFTIGLESTSASAQSCSLEMAAPKFELNQIQVPGDGTILDTSIEEGFDRYAAMASRIFKTPISLVTLVDKCRQWLESRVGFDAVNTTFCDFTMLEDVLVVENALEDPRFCENSLVLGPPYVRFYAGAALKVNGIKLGTLCVVDSVPRVFSEEDRAILRDIAGIVSDLLAERRGKELKIISEVALINNSILKTINQPLKILLQMKTELAEGMQTMKKAMASSQMNESHSICGQQVQTFAIEVQRFHKLLEMCLQVTLRLLSCRNTEWHGIVPCCFDTVVNVLREMALDIMPSQELHVNSTPLEMGATCVSYPDVMTLSIIALLKHCVHQRQKVTSLDISSDHRDNVCFTDCQLLHIFDVNDQHYSHRRNSKSNTDPSSPKPTLSSGSHDVGFSIKSNFAGHSFRKGHVSIRINVSDVAASSSTEQYQNDQSHQSIDELSAIMTILTWVSGTLTKTVTAQGVEYHISLPSILSFAKPETSSVDSEELLSSKYSLQPILPVASFDELEQILPDDLQVKPDQSVSTLGLGNLNIVRAIWKSFKVAAAFSPHFISSSASVVIPSLSYVMDEPRVER